MALKTRQTYVFLGCGTKHSLALAARHYRICHKLLIYLINAESYTLMPILKYKVAFPGSNMADSSLHLLHGAYMLEGAAFDLFGIWTTPRWGEAVTGRQSQVIDHC